MKWFPAILVLPVLVDAVFEILVLTRRLVRRRWSSLRVGVKWLNCGVVLVLGAWFWSTIGHDALSARWTVAIAGLVTALAIWGVVAFVASGPRFQGTATGGFVQRPAVRATFHYVAALALLLLVLTTVVESSASVRLLMLPCLLLAGAVERPEASGAPVGSAATAGSMG